MRTKPSRTLPHGWKTEDYSSLRKRRKSATSERGSTSCSQTKTGYKLLIKPSRESVSAFQHRLTKERKALVGHPAEQVVKRLNPILRGWANYFRIGASSQTFAKVDNHVFWQLMKWIDRTHPKKSTTWKRHTYFGQRRKDRADTSVFGKGAATLTKCAWTPIVRHMPVKHDASPDDARLREYWRERDRHKLERIQAGRYLTLARKQRGVCLHCRDSLNNGEELQIHHRVPRSEGGTNQLVNLVLLHLYCHQQRHRRKITHTLSREHSAVQAPDTTTESFEEPR